MAVSRTDDTYTGEGVDEFSDSALPQSLDERPARVMSTVIKTGWEEASKEDAKIYPTEFKFVDGIYTLVKFLDQGGPFAVYNQHFLQQKTEGKRSFISLGANDPLCTKLGSKPEAKKAFTIAVITKEGVTRQMLIASPRLYKSLHTSEYSPSGPLTKNYWTLSRTGKMQTTVYNVNPVKPRDLLEDYGLNETDVAIACNAIVPFTRADIKENTWEELDEIANKLLGR